jgi:hypothetical protein
MEKFSMFSSIALMVRQFYIIFCMRSSSGKWDNVVKGDFMLRQNRHITNITACSIPNVNCRIINLFYSCHTRIYCTISYYLFRSHHQITVMLVFFEFFCRWRLVGITEVILFSQIIKVLSAILFSLFTTTFSTYRRIPVPTFSLLRVKIFCRLFFFAITTNLEEGKKWKRFLNTLFRVKYAFARTTLGRVSFPVSPKLFEGFFKTALATNLRGSAGLHSAVQWGHGFSDLLNRFTGLEVIGVISTYNFGILSPHIIPQTRLRSQTATNLHARMEVF